jgi:hypothetical protein
MGRACSKNGDEEECIYDFDGKATRKDTTRTTDVAGWIILKWILDRMRWYGLD